jgi:hypothetical protein
MYVLTTYLTRFMYIRTYMPPYCLPRYWAWYGMVWYGMVWYGMVWYHMVWYGIYGMYGIYHTIHHTSLGGRSQKTQRGEK